MLKPKGQDPDFHNFWDPHVCVRAVLPRATELNKPSTTEYACFRVDTAPETRRWHQRLPSFGTPTYVMFLEGRGTFTNIHPHYMIQPVFQITSNGRMYVHKKCPIRRNFGTKRT